MDKIGFFIPSSFHNLLCLKNKSLNSRSSERKRFHPDLLAVFLRGPQSGNKSPQ